MKIIDLSVIISEKIKEPLPTKKKNDGVALDFTDKPEGYMFEPEDLKKASGGWTRAVTILEEE